MDNLNEPQHIKSRTTIKNEEKHIHPRRLETPHTKDNQNKPAKALFLRSRTLPRPPKDRREKAEVKVKVSLENNIQTKDNKNNPIFQLVEAKDKYINSSKTFHK